MSKQLAAIMHHPEFQKLEGSWRGLHYLVMNTETERHAQDQGAERLQDGAVQGRRQAPSSSIRARSSRSCTRTNSACPAASLTARLIGDYEFTNHPEDIGLLWQDVERGRGGVLPVHCRRPRPSCSASKAGTELSKPRDLEKIFDADRVHQVAVVSAIRKTRGSSALVDAARAVASALRQRDQADRGIQLRRSRAGRQGKPSPCRTSISPG